MNLPQNNLDMLKVEIKSKCILRESNPRQPHLSHLSCHYTNDAEYFHVYSLWPGVGVELTTTRLRVVWSIDSAYRDDSYPQRQFYHSHTNIYSVSATWNQWFYLHWSDLILSYQHIWKPLTLQWCPIGRY